MAQTVKGAPGNAKLQDFYQELELLLKKQLEENPGLDDVRVKLLELYFEQHRGEDFVRAARTYHRLLGSREARDWPRIASMGRMLVPGEALFSSQDSDRVEFVGLPGGATAAPARVQRFGEDERHAPLFQRLAGEYSKVRQDARFLADLERLLVTLPSRRPTPLVQARRLTEHVGGAQIYLKREDMTEENPHLTVAVLGQALLALRLGCKTIVTGTHDGRRGVVAAGVAARLGLQALVFMDDSQAERASANVLYMELLGAKVEKVKVSHFRNRDVREAALDYWGKHPADAFLLMGLDAAPPPYPVMTQEFTAAIGRELRRQLAQPGKTLPALIATRGSQTADALGLFPAFFADTRTRLVCVEPQAQAEPDSVKAGKADLFNQTGMPLSNQEKKVAQGILDRLEYPSVSREHALLQASGRVEYVESPRSQARVALQEFARLEGIVAPVGTAHVLACVMAEARKLKPEQAVVAMMAEEIDSTGWEVRRLVDEGAASPPRAKGKA